MKNKIVFILLLLLLIIIIPNRVNAVTYANIESNYVKAAQSAANKLLNNKITTIAQCKANIACYDKLVYIARDYKVNVYGISPKDKIKFITANAMTVNSNNPNPKLNVSAISGDSNSIGIGKMSNDSSKSYTVSLLTYLNGKGAFSEIQTVSDELASVMFLLFIGYLGLSLVIGKSISWGKEISYFILSVLFLMVFGQNFEILIINIVNEVTNNMTANLSGPEWFFSMIGFNGISTSVNNIAHSGGNPVSVIWNSIMIGLSVIKLAIVLIVDFIIAALGKLFIFVVLGIRNLLLVILWAFAPIVGALSIFPPYRKILIKWFKEVVIISSWKFTISLSLYVIYVVASGSIGNGAGNIETCALIGTGAVMVLLTPKITRALFEGGLAKPMSEAIKGGAMLAAAVGALVLAAPAVIAGASGAGAGASGAGAGSAGGAGASGSGTAGAGSSSGNAAGSSTGSNSKNVPDSGSSSNNTSGSNSGKSSSKGSNFKNIKDAYDTGSKVAKKAKETAEDEKTSAGENKE